MSPDRDAAPPVPPNPGVPGRDRRLHSAEQVHALRFDAAGLIPVVAQDRASGAVLMLAWATREALLQTLATGEMHYWSRSRGELWHKGATSGSIQRLISLHGDCDGDSVLAVVDTAGPACHTGDATCFGDGVPGGTDEAGKEGAGVGPPSLGPALDALWRTLAARSRSRPEGSYTARLLADENLRLKKLGEETAELITALAKGGPPERIREEGTDLLYHLLVALLAAGVAPGELAAELEGRRRDAGPP